MDAKRPTPRHIIIKMQKVKDKEGNLKSSKRKAVSYLKGIPHKTIKLISQKKLCRLEVIGKKYSKRQKARTYNQDYSTQQNYYLESKDRQRVSQTRKS